MWFLALYVNLLGIGDLRVLACPHPLKVEVQTSAPLFTGERTMSGITCGTNIEMLYFDPQRGKRTGRLSVEMVDATQVRVVLEDVRHRLRIERDSVLLDTPTELAVTKGRRNLTAQVTVSAAPPQSGVVSVRASNKIYAEIVEQAATASGWTVRGTDVLEHCRISSQIDAIELRFLLTLAAVQCAADVTFVGNSEAVFSRRGGLK